VPLLSQGGRHGEVQGKEEEKIVGELVVGGKDGVRQLGLACWVDE